MSDGGVEDGDRSLSGEAVERAVAAIRPEWRIRDATLADDGHLAVYYLGLDASHRRDATDAASSCTDAASPVPERAVLKATPPDDEFRGVHAEPRLLSLVADRTSLPVPEVYGVVDDREGLPTPCFLMETVDDAGHVADYRDLSVVAHERLARTSGRYLAELHELDVVDAFGTVAWNGDHALDSGTPEPGTDADALGVVDGDDEWPAVVAHWIDLECSNLGETRFADRQAELRGALDARLGALEFAAESGDVSFDPVLARIDHGLHNVVLANEEGDVAGVIDWAFTLATTRAYDLAVVADVLLGGAHAYRDDHPDRRGVVTDALLEGYRERAGRIPDEYRAHGGLYSLLATVRCMNHLQRVLDDEPPEVIDDAARGLRERAERLA